MQNDTDTETDENAGDVVAQTQHHDGKLAVIANRLARLAQWEKIEAFMRSREPRPLGTCLAALGVCILVGLGTWQVIRLDEKNALLEQVQKSLSQTPVVMGDGGVADADIWRKMNYQAVELHGNWMTLRSFRLAPRSFEEQHGYHWIMPFRLQNGQVVLVNRGFVRDGVKPVPPGGNEQYVSGVVWLAPEEKPRFVPDNIPSKGEWVWQDVQAMGHEVGVGGIAPVIIYESLNPVQNDYPIGGQLPLPFHNRHQQYALTWYCMALALIGVWLVASGPKASPAGVKPAENGNNIAEDGDQKPTGDDEPLF